MRRELHAAWFFAILIVAVAAGAQVCPNGLETGFEGGDAAGWGGALQTTLTVQPTGGNLDGWAELTPNTTIAVMQTWSAPWAGAWASDGVNLMALDLRFSGGDASNPRVRVRADASTPAWLYIFAAVGPDDGGWHHYEVAFDPTWTDPEAIAAGWVFEGADEITFAATMAGFEYLEVWVDNAGTIGVDNVAIGCLGDRCSTGDREGWDDSDPANWVGASSTAALVRDVGGYPDGWMELTPAVNQAVLQTSSPPFSGDWSGLGYGSFAVDVQAFGSDAANLRLRVRANATVPGWWFTLAPTIPADGHWHTHLGSFDPDWSNAEAEAAGWIYGGTDEITFADTMASVTYVEVWTATQGTLGLDNVTRCHLGIFEDDFETGLADAWTLEVP